MKKTVKKTGKKVAKVGKTRELHFTRLVRDVDSSISNWHLGVLWDLGDGEQDYAATHLMGICAEGLADALGVSRKVLDSAYVLKVEVVVGEAQVVQKWKEKKKEEL